ncbi:zf-HC2 domain-containing protein [Nocardia otitidiscaviarum]|uniref:zf-HC2 domain-containing protein n=1 Tax=Nocardia otitidiscaviarum TaxID=1823 RepID=UPI0024555B11|nr:zf-HC2 domain-containing protein [Nocardia otitidiscaviarum]
MTETVAGREPCAAYETWDGPYVLGALTRAERRDYEEHLAGCDHCRAAVTELAGLPGLLALVTAETAEAVATADTPADTVPPPPDRLLSGLTARARREQRRARLWSIGGALAAAAAAVLIAVPVTAAVTDRATAPVQQVVAQGPLESPDPVPITATFELLAVNGESRVDMWCAYAASDYAYQWRLSLWVVRTDGTESKLAEWTAAPGQEFTPDGTTSVPPDRLRAIEVRDDAGRVLLSAVLER